MSEALNVTKAAFGGLREVTTAPLWQYDYGQILQITGLDLPQAFEVHFSNSRKSGETITQIGTDSQVTIPDMYLTSGADIYAFIFLHDGLTDGETEYVIKIPVRERPQPSDIEPTPEQQSAIDQAIAALNVAVTQTGQDVISADASATAAAQSATEAQTAARSAQGSATSASGSATTASNAASTATTKASEAATSAASAASAKTAAETAETNAKAAQTAAEAAAASIAPVDPTLSITGRAADAKATGDRLDSLTETVSGKQDTLTFDDAPTSGSANPVKSGGVYAAVDTKVSKPLTNPMGTNGQLLRTLGNGQTEWVDQGLPTDEQTAQAVSDWLDDHPEATTTVEDGAVTWTKLNSAVQEEIDGKAPAIVVTSASGTSHDGLGTLPHEVTIPAFSGRDFGDAYYANDVSIFDVSDQLAKTKAGVTITPLSNNAFLLNGTATGVTLSEFLYFPEDQHKCPIYGEKIVVKAYTTQQIRLLIRQRSSTNYTELRDVTISTTNQLIDLPIAKTIKDTTTGLSICFASTANTVFDNVIVWIGIYHEGTTVTSLSQSPPVQFTNASPRINTLFYPSTVEYVADTKSYVDNLSIDINDKLSYVTPEKYYGGFIPNNVDAQPYISQALSYAKAHNLPLYCGGDYYTATPLDIVSNNLLIVINRLNYIGNTDYAIRFSGNCNKFFIKNLYSNADGFQLAGSSTQDASHNNLTIDYANCVGDVFKVVSINGETLINGRNSYNYLYITRGISTTGSIVNIPSGCGFSEGRIYGQSCKTDADYVIKALNGQNKFYNFCLEAEAYNGILTDSGQKFVDFRTAELENMVGKSGGVRKLCKLIGPYTENVSFEGTYPLPMSFDLSDIVEPPENIGDSTSGWRYGLLVEKPIIRCDNTTKRLSDYYQDSSKYYLACGAYYYNFKKHLICKDVGQRLLEITDATVDMDHKDPVSMLDIKADATITLTHSYCADGIAKLLVRQNDGHTAIIVDASGTTIFDGTNEGDGVFEIDFYKKKVTYTPNTTPFYTYYFGENSEAIVRKLTDVL